MSLEKIKKEYERYGFSNFESVIKDKTVIEEAKNIYKALMIVSHDCLKAEMADEKTQIAFIKDFLKVYPSYKKRIFVLLDVCKQVYVEQSSEKKKDSHGYLG